MNSPFSAELKTKSICTESSGAMVNSPCWLFNSKQEQLLNILETFKGRFPSLKIEIVNGFSIPGNQLDSKIRVGWIRTVASSFTLKCGIIVILAIMNSSRNISK